jgi:hypothetical protein
MSDPTDPVAALASSMHAGPGTFALLVGSGVSRSAEVPTAPSRIRPDVVGAAPGGRLGR